jgi:hypothetical protein
MGSHGDERAFTTTHGSVPPSRLEEESMYPVMISVRRDLPGEINGVSPAELIDILWAHAAPEDGLEHIGLCIKDDALEIALFVKAASPEDARYITIGICRRVLSASPRLADYRLVATDTLGASIKISRPMQS